MSIQNRELSQFGSFIKINDSTQKIGITTQFTPYVGIGLVDPQTKLHVVGDVTIDGNLYYNGQLITGNFNLYTTGILTANSFYNTLGQKLVAFDSWDTLGSTIYRLNGNVGIGTSNVSQKLHVNGNVLANNYYGNGSNLSGIVTQITAGTNISISGSSGNIIINSSSTSSSYWAKNEVGINTSDNVGIGTTNPTSKLHVTGDGRFTGVVTASNFIGNLTGTATTSTNSAFATTSTNVIGGIGSLTSLNVSGISTLGILKISSGIVTATSGIITYYGDGSKLEGINFGEGSAVNIFTDNTNSNQYITYAAGIGTRPGLGVINTFVFNPSSGNFGLGIGNPTSKLHVIGDVNISDNVTASRYVSSVATGTAPFTVSSTTKVTNLNADLLDGYNTGTSGSAIPLLDGANTWSSAQTFSSTSSFSATGTAPFTVSSTTKVTNLNADLLDGYNTGTSGFAIPLLNGANTWGNTQTFNPAPSFSATGTAPFTVSSTTKVTNLNADNVDGYGYTTASGSRWSTLAVVGSDGVMEIGKYIDFHDTDGNTSDHTFRLTNTSDGNLSASGAISATRFTSNVATGTAPFTVSSTTKVTNLNADLLDGYDTGTSGSAIPLLNGANTWSAQQTISNSSLVVTNNSSSNAVRITQTGIGNALVVEDDTNPDATPFVVNAVGDVGIGLLNPTTKLTVQGGVRISKPTDDVALTVTGTPTDEANNYGFRIKRTTTGVTQLLHNGTNNFDIMAIDNASMAFFTNSNERLAIYGDGATTLKAPTFKIYNTAGNIEVLQVNTSNRTITANATIGITTNSTSNAVRITQTGTGNALVVEDETNPDATPFVVTAAGLVGIGLLNPSAKLDVSGGNLLVRNFSSNNGIQIGYGRANNAEAFVDLIGDASYTNYGLRIIRGGTGLNANSQIKHRGTGNLELNTEDGGNILLSSASTIMKIVGLTGFVGIGEDSPNAKLNVKTNDPGGYAAIFYNDGNSPDRYGITVQCGNDNATLVNIAITIKDGDGTEQGSATFTSGTVTWGPFTANHDCIIPSYSQEIPYGTILTVNDITYKTTIDGTQTERGIEYISGISTTAYVKNLLGAYSGVYGDPLTATAESKHQVLVLGDGHIRCCGEKGNIKVGDGITSSSREGIGMKMDKIGMIIGIAQEDVNFEEDEVKLVPVQYGLQQYIPDNIAEYLESLMAN